MDILQSVFEWAKVDAGIRVVGGFCRSRSGWLDDDASSDCSKIGKVGLFTGAALNGTVGKTGNRKCIFDA